MRRILKHVCVDQRTSPFFLGPRSKYVLQEALSSDAEFLASSNVMDYSYVAPSFFESLPRSLPSRRV